MAENKSVGNPLGADKQPGSALDTDATEYVRWIVDSTNHWFYAPEDKYKDIADTLGLVKAKDNQEGESARKLAQNESAYVRLRARLDGGGVFSLICDPEKLGDALKDGVKKKVYGKNVDRIYLPKKRVLI